MTLRVRDLIELAQEQYELNGCAFARIHPYQQKYLMETHGDLPVAAMTFELIESYKLVRIRQGWARDTVNRELNGLQKGFKVALDAGLVDHIPVIRLLRRGKPRTGFVLPAHAERIFAELPPDPRDVARWAFWSGWRRGEIFGLKWSCTSEDWAWCFDKNGEIKRAPLEGHLRAVANRRRKLKIAGCPWVFHREGRQIRVMRKSWKTAVKNAGFEGTLFHDLRRSFCRNAVRCGIDRDVVMQLSGHKDPSVFSRYNITNEADLIDAAKKLAKL